MSVYTEFPYLLDRSFLDELAQTRLRTEFCKIILLDWNTEDEIEEVQGRTIGGTINIDNASSLRRTASLQMVITDDDLPYQAAASKISINKKVKVLVGIRNKLDKYLDFDILWFPLGYFVITSVSLSHSTNGTTASLNLKDKMVLLNGECGGTLPASVTFSEIEVLQDDGTITIENPTMYQIIYEAVNHYGGEQLGKILIKGLDKRAKQVVRWNGDNPIYIYMGDQNEYSAQSCQISYVPLPDYKEYAMGDDIGYFYTDFTYPGELIGNAGDTVVTVLDKIKNALGNFEYFYDVDGIFHFQEIENYLNTSQSSNALTQLNRTRTSDTIYNYSYNLEDSESYIINAGLGKSVYDFTDNKLITSISNSPNYGNIKNDFIVWGIRKTVTGQELPIRYHLAIDTKPECQTHTELKISTDELGNTIASIPITEPQDKLNAIYELDKQYVESLQKTQELMILEYEQNLQNIINNTNKDYNTKKAEMAAEVDRIGFMSVKEISDYKTVRTDYIAEVEKVPQPIESKDWRTELYLQGVEAEGNGTAYNDYYIELMNEWPKMYQIVKEPGKEIGFKPQYQDNPADLDYFLDFIDTGSALGEYSVQKIGRRTKVLVDNSINCIFEPKVNDVIFISTDMPSYEGLTPEQQEQECIDNNQTYCRVEDEAYKQIALGGLYNGADVAIKDLLYQYTNYNEAISIQCIPIYHLDVNQRITIQDTATGIGGDFIIKNISCPLGYNGTMTISANIAQMKI